MKTVLTLLLFIGNLVFTSAQVHEDTTLYQGSKKNAWKLDLISPLFGSTIFGYERSIRPGLSLEGNVGIIGMGHNRTGNRSRGSYIKFGPRFMRTPHLSAKSLPYHHPLKGTYFQPHVVFGAHEFNYPYYKDDPNSWFIDEKYYAREITRYLGIIATVGRQFVFANSYLVDIYAGVGCGFANTTHNNKPPDFYYRNKDPNTYGFFILPSGFGAPLALQLGLKSGFLTK